MQPKTCIFPVLALSALAACMHESPKDAGPQDCGATAYQNLVGRPLAAASWDNALSVRVIEYDTVVTLDYVPTRMNIRVGKDGRISAVDCG